MIVLCDLNVNISFWPTSRFIKLTKSTAPCPPPHPQYSTERHFFCYMAGIVCTPTNSCSLTIYA